jgi:hypothetical protein
MKKRLLIFCAIFVLLGFLVTAIFVLGQDDQSNFSNAEHTEDGDNSGNYPEIIVDGRAINTDNIQSFQVREYHQIFETLPTPIYSESIEDLIQIDVLDISVNSKSGGLLTAAQLNGLSRIKLNDKYIYFPAYDVIQGTVFENMLNVLTMESVTDQGDFVGRSRYAIPLGNNLARKITVRYVSAERIGMEEYEFLLYRIYRIASRLESYK